MGAGASVAHELSLPAIHNNLHHVGKSMGGVKPLGGQYGEMLVHLRLRFQEEMEILRTQHGEVDQNVLLVRLLQEEIAFSTVEVNDLAALKLRQRAEGRVYVLGDTHFLPPPVADGGLVASSLTPKALEMAGDDKLSVVARESLPTNVKTKKKAVELMGSMKVVTEKKALKRLGSEMTDNMRSLQIKTERRELKKAEDHHRSSHP